MKVWTRILYGTNLSIDLFDNAKLQEPTEANKMSFDLSWMGQYELKEYYEIVNEARPLSWFHPTDADCFTEMHL